MTQITKTLSIAGIIAMVVAPAMADIASTAYVQNALSGITGALDAKLSNNATGGNVAIGNNASARGDAEEDIYTVAIGRGANAYDNLGVGEGAVAIGPGATAKLGGVSIGPKTKSGIYGVAIGVGAKLGDDAYGAIQLGSGTNDHVGTFQVSLTDYDVEGGDYELLNLYGIIPAERLTGVDSTSSITSNKILQFNSTTKQMQWVDAPSVPEGVLSNNATGTGSVALGGGTTTAENSVVVGNNALAAFETEWGYGADNSVVLGNGAKATEDAQSSVVIGNGTTGKAENAITIGKGATVNGSESVAIGAGASCMVLDSVAVGGGAQTSVGSGIAIGSSARTSADMAIQLGQGTNSQGGTLQVYDYQLLDENGKIPAERLSLASLLPELPAACNTVKCALVHDNTDGAYKWEVVKVSE